MSLPKYRHRPYLLQLDGTREKDGGDAADGVVQQDLSSRPFFDDIFKGGLQYAWATLKGLNPEGYKHKLTANPKHVIVVGAGMAGLSAAFELSQAGHKVTILELQHRAGGRVYTIRQKFSHDQISGPKYNSDLHAEGGPMRLPPSHYLTFHYINLFRIDCRRFQNVNENAYLYIYRDKIRISDWNKTPGKYCDKYWKGWDARLNRKVKNELNITGITSYYEATMKPVMDELRADTSPEGWERWVKKWSRYSALEFLTSEVEKDTDKHGLRPWPQEAVKAYTTTNYSVPLTISLVEALRDELGEWWKDPLYTPTEGMSSIARGFIKQNDNGWNKSVHLNKDIHYGIKVESVEEVRGKKGEKRVTVSGRNQASKKSVSFEGDAVIITVPLTILRGMKVPLPLEKQKAIENVHYESSTKILLQCKRRFWQDAPYNIAGGGFSKTNLPIGQLHYPDWDGAGISSDERGILLVYTWGPDALIWGAMTEEEAIENAVKQIAEIHPEIEDEECGVEAGALQAWSSDPDEEGAFALLQPNEFKDAVDNLQKPDHPVYLAGEAISWANGWIQGALESGLLAAYQFYEYNEPDPISNRNKRGPPRQGGGKPKKRQC